MRQQHLHHKPAARELIHAVSPMDFKPLHLTTKALNEDSCWDEFDSEYEESLPSHVLAFLGEMEQ